VESLLPSRHYLLVVAQNSWCTADPGWRDVRRAGQGGDLFDVFWRQGKAEDIRFSCCVHGGGFGYRNCPIVQVPREDVWRGDVVFGRAGGDDRTASRSLPFPKGLQAS